MVIVVDGALEFFHSPKLGERGFMRELREQRGLFRMQ